MNQNIAVVLLLTITTTNLTSTSYHVQMSSEYEKPQEIERMQKKKKK